MKKNHLHRILSGALLLIFLMTVSMQSALACTRAVYFGKEGQTVTGRTMDWLEDVQSNLWVFPRGMARGGDMGKESLKWTSTYGSVIASAYESGTSDGMNEKGLVANMLYLAESEYPPEDKRPTLVTGAVVQYLLDSFATVEEAVAAMRREAFRVVTIAAPNGAKGTVHFSISDSSGDSAIFEYIKGKLVIHHGRLYQVMTNSPVYDDQLALYEYWKQIGGTVMLPGTNRAADRFARASFYINAAAQSANMREAVAAVFSVMRNVSVPRGISTPTQPNIPRPRSGGRLRTRRTRFTSSRTPRVRAWCGCSSIGSISLRIRASASSPSTAIRTSAGTRRPISGRPRRSSSWHRIKRG